MRVELISTAVLLLVTSKSQVQGRKVNCGFVCYRWSKCMGQLDGSNRPGQLGDTGIIVLNTCSPLDKGCDCANFVDESTSTRTTTTTTESNNFYSGYSSYNRGLNRSHPQLRRVPRKQDQEHFKESTPTRSYSTSSSSSSSSSSHGPSRVSSSYSSYRRHLNRYQSNRTDHTTTQEPTTTTTSPTTTRRSFFTRNGGGYTRRFRLSERL